MFDTLFAALVAPFIAKLISAFLRASTSLTPSPLIATVFPAFCNTATIFCFCSGVTRPKISFSRTVFSKFSSVTFVISIALASSLKPAFLATPYTAIWLSPLIIFTSTPCDSKYLNVSFVFSLISSDRTTCPTSFILVGVFVLSSV